MSTTIYDIAHKANISYAAVSTILNSSKPHRYAEKTVDRVKQLARELGYRRNHFATSLKKGKTNLIGVAVATNELGGFELTYPAKVYQGISSFFAGHEYNLVFQQFPEKTRPGHYVELAQSRIVDGMVLLLFSREIEAFKEKELPIIRETGVPFVAVHSLLYDLGCPVVGVDCIKGGRTAAEHLVGHGYNSIGIAYDPAVLHHADFFTGYRQALADAGRGVDPQYVYTFSGHLRPAGYHLAAQMLATGSGLPRALFVAEDMIADGMIRRFTEAGVRIPQDLAIIGFGDFDEGSAYFTGLTSLQQPAVRKGQAAAELLLKLIEHPAECNPPPMLFIEPELTIRKTCGCGEAVGASI